MNEREDYLDRLLRGVEGTPEEEPEDFLESYDNKFSTEETDEFLQAFEKSMSQSGNEPDLGLKTDMDFDMGDLDHIVSNVKSGILDDLEDYGSLDDGKDLPIEESLKDYEDNMGLDEIGTEFNSNSQDYMVNTLDENDDMGYEPEDSNKELLEMLSGMGEDSSGDELGLGQETESQHNEDAGIPGDELESMAKELAMEIDELGLGSSNELESVLEEDQEAEESETSKKEKKKKDKKKRKEKEDQEENLGFLQKLSRILFGEDDELEEESNIAIPEISEIENISDENMDILRELEKKKDAPEDEEKALKAQKKKEKKEQKEQKKKERAEKKAQKAKEKQAKPKKVKKVKEPKVVEKTKPLPKGPVFLIMLVGISLVILINLLSSQIGYSLSVSDAKKYYEQGDYVEAYTCFSQGDNKVKKADEELYNKAKLTAYVQQQINNYKTYQKQKMYAEALNALVCGVGRYDKNAADAAAAGAAVEYEKMLAKMEKALKKNYSMTLDEARELYDIRDKKDYTYTLYDVIDSLGLTE